MRRRDFLAGLAFWGAPAPPRRFTVMSYNIHHGEGMDRRIDLPRIAGVIRAASPSLVALQEVDRSTKRSGGVDQLAELARLTGMEPFFGKTMDYAGGEYGNAILSAVRVTGHRNGALPGREPRALLSVQTAAGFSFFATHLDVGRDEAMRLESAERILAAPESPAILAGDFNCTRGSAAMAKLATGWTVAGGELPTIPSKIPARQIDFILVRPAKAWRVESVRVPDEPVASDHRPIVAVLEQIEA